METVKEPTGADIAAMRTLIRLCDLQRGYDDIDWRDKMKEIVPLFAGALAAQREADATIAETQLIAEHDNSTMPIGINIGVQRAVDAIRGGSE